MTDVPAAGGDTTVCLHILGRVQGVGYRAWCVQTARRLGLRGWVRNVTDGSVEAVVCGSESAISRLIVAAHAGPPLARVTEVIRTSLDGSVGQALSGFQQAPTAPLGSPR